MTRKYEVGSGCLSLVLLVCVLILIGYLATVGALYLFGALQ